MRSLPWLALLPGLVSAQVPADLAREREEYARWLAEAPNSPLVAKAQLPVGNGIRLGPADADVPLPGFGDRRIVERNGRLTLESGQGGRVLPRHRLTTIGGYALYPGGEAGRTVVTVFGGNRLQKSPTYFPYDSTAVFVGPLINGDRASRVRILTLDGVEVEATDVGSVVVPDGGQPTRLRVYRIPEPGTEELDLMIYFRDATGDHGSYPAGRFLTLIPLPDGRYRLDFNRARNPFCAYTGVYACPAPWPGNRLRSAIAAGERYEGGPSENQPGAPR